MDHDLTPLQQQKVVVARYVARHGRECFGMTLAEAQEILRREKVRLLAGGKPIPDNSVKYTTEEED